MDIQKRFAPKVGPVLELLGRLLTRNQKNPVTRNADRLQFLKNFASLGERPQDHLAYALQLIDKYAELRQEPTFEMGMVLGCAIAFCAGNLDALPVLRRVTAEVEHQQECLDGLRTVMEEDDEPTDEALKPEPHDPQERPARPTELPARGLPAQRMDGKTKNQNGEAP